MPSKATKKHPAKPVKKHKREALPEPRGRVLHREAAEAHAARQKRSQALTEAVVPKGWTRIGIVLDDDGHEALWIGKGMGKNRKFQTLSLEV